LAKLQPVAAVAEDPDFVFSFPQCDDLFGALVEFRDVSFCYPGEQTPIFPLLNLVFTNVNKNKKKKKIIILKFLKDCRICMTGKNGQGKSTILKLLLGDLEVFCCSLAANDFDFVFKFFSAKQIKFSFSQHQEKFWLIPD
jgi:ABC-type transport system involved in cytochrome bd biosynthesis fused ATPase/permease subunit